MPMEEQILRQETGSLDEPVLPEEEALISLEDQILSRIDKKGKELAPADAAFNSNFADDIPEAVRDKIAAYLEEVTAKDTKNRAPWLDIIEKAKTLLGFKSSREPLYRDPLSHHRTSDVAYGGFAVMFTKS
jgi:hypothetical protein